MLQSMGSQSRTQFSNWTITTKGKESVCNVRDPGSILGSGRTPEGGHGNLLQCSCLENPMDRGAWRAQRLGLKVTKTWTQLSNWHFHFTWSQNRQSFKFAFSSVQFSHSVVSDSLWPHEPQHARPPCPSPTPGVHPNPCPLSRRCHPTISSSVVPFSSCPQSFPASGYFPVSQLFASGGQNIGVSVSTSVLPMNTQARSPLGWTGWISLQSKGFSSLLQHHSSKASILWHSAFFIVQLSHPYMTTGKTIVLTRWTFVGKVMSLLFNMLSRLIITFLLRSKHLLISWLQWF